MKSILSLLALFILLICTVSCTKENADFKKMPDSGNVVIKCSDK